VHFKDDLESLRRRFYNILNHSKWRKIEKDMPKCSVIRLMFGGGMFTVCISLGSVNLESEFLKI